MTIGFDAKRLFHNHTGLGVYSRLLIEGLKELHTDDEFILFAKQASSSKYHQGFSHLPIIQSSQMLWRTWMMTKDISKNNCQIFHGLSNELPIGLNRTKIKTLVTIHDVIFKRDPSLYPLIDRTIYNLKWKHSATTSDLIIAVSQSTKSDLSYYYGINEDKIRVIYPPVREVPTNQDIGQIINRYKLPKKFFLSVGSLTQRKNIISILKGMLIMKSELRIPLVIIGEGPDKKILQQFIYDKNLSDLVHFLGHVTDEEVPLFYKAAYALIYPSFYEGFGLPIVEALMSQTPVITSNTSSMPEAAGAGGLLIDPANPEEIAAGMQRLLEDNSYYNQLSIEGNLHAQQFRPNVICSKQLKIYHELVG
ncbi:MAG: glycosyltransferase family 4 protein [Saprospiraceae bacterium]|nr:glycosyltransferase family 4 protein [Saprospiraceae bacterium]